MSLDWTPKEMSATVAAYLRMLAVELTGLSYNNSEHMRALRQLLPDRSEKVIEFKHGNISAVMLFRKTRFRPNGTSPLRSWSHNSASK